MKTVAIVGGGFSGTALAATLLDFAQTPLDILLFDRSGTFGAGIAYGTDDPNHWLNVPSAGMSAFEDRPDHFVDWLRENPGDEEQGFATRATYRRYLQSLLALPPRNPASRLRMVSEEVVGLEATGCLRTAGGTRFGADVIVLATGYLRESAYGSLPPPGPVRNVVIVGAGLSALDAAATIFGRYPEANVTCFSRHGLTPRTFEIADRNWVPTSPYPLGSVRKMLRWLREEVARAPWISVFEGMRPHWETVWQSLDERDRARFRRHLARRFECHRHRIPPPLHRFLAPFRASGALRVRAAKGEMPEADWTLDATGPAWRWSESAEPLYQRLFARQIVAAGPLGLGLQADENGRINDHLYALGPLLRGSRWETTAVREIRRQVMRVVEAITSEAIEAKAPSPYREKGRGDRTRP